MTVEDREISIRLGLLIRLTEQLSPSNDWKPTRMHGMSASPILMIFLSIIPTKF